MTNEQLAESRVEEILQSQIDGTEYTEPPQSRVEALLLELQTKPGGEGVKTFNGRSGLVEPKFGDYSAALISANDVNGVLSETPNVQSILDMLIANVPYNASVNTNNLTFTEDHTYASQNLNYKAIVTNQSVKDTDMVDFGYDLSVYDKAIGVESFNGGINVYCEEIPTTNFIITAYLVPTITK